MQGTKNTAQPFGRVNAVVGLPPINVNEIYLGDSFELCERVPAKTVDLILEDMPYNITACEWDLKIDLQLYWETRLRILKPTGVVILTAAQPFTSMLLMSNQELYKYNWVWDKSRPSNFLNAKFQPLRVVEDILVFYNGRTTFNPILRERDKQNIRRTKAKYKKENTNTYGKTRKIYGYNEGREIDVELGYPLNLITEKTVGTFGNKREHPTQKPVGLFEYLIRTYTNEGDLVFDGFGGSGTTAIAAYKAKRNFIVIEKEEKYYKLATERLRNERAQCRLF